MKINRFWILIPDQKGIAGTLVLDAIQEKLSVQYKDSKTTPSLI